MRYEHEKARRQAENRISEVNRYLDSNKVKDPKKHTMLENMREKAYNTLKHINDMERMDDDDRSPYKNTNIGYRTAARRQRTYADTNDLVNDAMDLVDRILPHIADDDRYDVDNRRGVPGTGRRRVRRVRADRYDNRYDTNDRYDDDTYDADDDRYDDVDDAKVYNMPRWRSARTGRFLPNLYGPRRVRRVRRSDMDDRYDDDRYDDRYDDMERTTDEARRTTDEARRAADDARRAADEARRTADDARTTSPVMRTTDHTARYDDTRSDRRYDRTNDDARRPGPTMTS